ncbi:MAG: hypothetical protein ACLP6G_02560 [Terriglobales bacterium]
MYSDPNPQDHYSELFIIYGETLAVWDAAEPNPDEKFKKNTDTLSPTDPEHCKTLDELYQMADAQLLSRAKSGFKYMFVRDFFDPPFYKRYEILANGTRVELPLE